MITTRNYEAFLRKTFHANLIKHGLPALSNRHVRRSSDIGHTKKLRLENFRLLRTIGTGTFARVRLARHKASDKPVVIKIMKKVHILKKQQVEHVKNERRMLQLLNSPFIVTLLGTFQDSTNLYMILEYVPGGELYSYIRSYKAFAPEVAKFYAAEVAAAFYYMHSLQVVYRDLKPENLLINRNGHIKLVDFGFVKTLRPGEKTYTLCGTPEYLAPELVLQLGHEFAVDWWTLGVFVYEMIVGQPPFVADDPSLVYQLILEQDPEWPEDLDEVVKDFIEGLLKKNPASRSGVDTVKSHPFFRNIHWKDVEELRLKPPLVPVLKGAEDSSCFDKYPEDPSCFEGKTVNNDIFEEF